MEVEIVLHDKAGQRRTIEKVELNGKTVILPVYSANEAISGAVVFNELAKESFSPTVEVRIEEMHQFLGDNKANNRPSFPMLTSPIVTKVISVDSRTSFNFERENKNRSHFSYFGRICSRR